MQVKGGARGCGQPGKKTRRGEAKGAPLDQGLGDPFSPPGPSPKTHLPETDSAPLAAFESLAISKQPLGPNRNTAIPAPVPNELNSIAHNTHLRQEHNYCSPKKNQSELQPDSLTNNAFIRTLNSESPMKTDIFDEFFSASALNSLANDTLDLPHFDEYLFENC